MNVIIQGNEVIHLSIHGHTDSDNSRRKTALEILKQLLADEYPTATLKINQNMYGDTFEVILSFSNAEEATQFKLTYLMT